uniref:Twin-arginine translocation pathway signal n=1 Tax=mine drainage metagenome TaxID=410659 RepID=E6QTM1_9ZZZZ
MINIRYTLRNLFLVAVATLSLSALTGPANAASTEDLTRDSTQALELLYKTHPVAKDISKHADAVLVFPKVIKAGLVFGGSYGEGVLFKGSKVAGYYNTVSASWGWQAGAQSYSYVVFLMNNKAMKYIHKSDGWEVGVGPTVVVMNDGIAKNLSTTTLKDDAYAFIFDQQGLMASLSLEGTKITRINKP